jgi:hypothetical protein
MQWTKEILEAEHKIKFIHAIYRKKSDPKTRTKKATVLYGKFNEAGRRGGTGGVLHNSKFNFRFGLHGWMEKLAGLHWGDTKYREHTIHARPLLGLNQADLKFVEKAYADHAMKRIEKANSD